MKKLYALSLLFLCIVTRGFSFEGSFQDGCYCQSPCCCFEFAAEYLYMQSSIDQPYYIIERDARANPNGKRFANDQRWHSGYRLDAIYRIPCNCLQDYVRARWTHFPCFRNNDSRFGTFEAVLNHPEISVAGTGNASIKNHFNFYYLDLLFGERIYCSPCLRLALEAGIKFSHFRWSEHVEYDLSAGPIPTFVDNKFHFNGVGPELALDFSYHFMTCLSINGRASASLLINERNSRHRTFFVEAGTTFSGNNECYWFGTPTYETRFGLNYHTPLCFCGWDNVNFNVEVGYEVIYYMNAIDRIQFTNSNNEGTSFIEHQDFTLHGPYFHLGFCF